MSDLAAPEVQRKRSRSSSPNGGASPAAAKKANIEPTGPSNLSSVIAADPTTTTSPPPTSTPVVDSSSSIPLPAAGDETNPTATSTTAVPMSTSNSTTDAMQTDDVPPPTPTTTNSNDVAPMAVDPSASGADLPAIPAPVSEADQAAAAAASTQIQMRALIVTQDAAVIIGKAGKNIHEIRDKSGSKITITEAVPGNPERVMHIGGPLDAVSKAFGLVVRRINDEPFDVPSVPGSRAVTIRFIIPNARMGSVIGKAGSKIKEIQEASGARLQASEAMLPGSTERVLSVSGVADAIHIAVYYIGTILQEHPVANVTHTTYRPAGGSGNNNNQYASSGGGGGGGGGDYGRGPSSRPPATSAAATGPGSQTQQIYIPNELVGAIIGKGGQKINEIRHHSQCSIKICEPGEQSPGANPAERLVTITGQAAGIQVAVRLLYQRLEQERDKKAAAL